MFEEKQSEEWHHPWAFNLDVWFLWWPRHSKQFNLHWSSYGRLLSLRWSLIYSEVFFLFHFSSKANVVKVLTEGSWTLRGEVLHQFPCKSDLQPLMEYKSQVLLWNTRTMIVSSWLLPYLKGHWRWMNTPSSNLLFKPTYSLFCMWLYWVQVVEVFSGTDRMALSISFC